MIAIAAVDRNWAIGKDGKLLANIPADMKYFREETTGNVIVMGRKTLDSFPGGRALPDRVNIVLTRDMSFERKNVVVAHSVEELDEILAKYDKDRVFCVGGSSIYEQLLPKCDKAYITQIDYEYAADAYFPNLDEKAEWVKTQESEEQTYFDICFAFTTYERR